MRKNSGFKKIIACLLTALSLLLFCSCSTEVSISQDESHQEIKAPDKYEYGNISIESITAVVGSKPLINSKVKTEDGAASSEYKYSGLTSADIDSYGEYLLKNGFEEIQSNIYSRSTPEGYTLRITLNDQTVTLDGSEN